MLAETAYPYLNLDSVAALPSMMQRLELEVLQIGVQQTTRSKRAIGIRWQHKQSSEEAFLQSRQPLRPGDARGVRMMSLKYHIPKHTPMRPNSEAALAHSLLHLVSADKRSSTLHLFLAPRHMPNSASRFWIWHILNYVL